MSLLARDEIADKNRRFRNWSPCAHAALSFWDYLPSGGPIFFVCKTGKIIPEETKGFFHEAMWQLTAGGTRTTSVLSACGVDLAGCSSSFWHGKMHVFLLLFSAGTRNDLPPLTRAWMSEED